MADDPERPSPIGEDGARRIVEQAFEFWINPEIKRRIEDRQLTAPLELYMAQVVWPPEGDLQVRLNGEIKGHAWTKLNRAVDKGDPVLISDMEGLAGFELEDEELDCAHLTLISNGKGWVASFNFLRKRARGLALLAKADEFLVAARGAHLRKHPSVVIDNLFSACELASKADLLTSSFLSEETNHKAIQSALNYQKKLGNIEGAFVDLFNRLSRLRPFYRYASQVSDAEPVSNDDLELAQSMIEKTQARIGRLSKDKLIGDPMTDMIKVGE